MHFFLFDDDADAADREDGDEDDGGMILSAWLSAFFSTYPSLPFSLPVHCERFLGRPNQSRMK